MNYHVRDGEGQSCEPAPDHHGPACFSEGYYTARSRFLDAAAAIQWATESIPIAASGPAGEPLFIDVARSDATASPLHPGADPTLLVTSGVHGVEGFFGSAVQLAALQRFARQPLPERIRMVFVHSVNPYGFAWLRRVNEANLDPNRNFLLPGETYGGAPPLYPKLDSLLNPKRPPSRFDPFLLRAIGCIARHGMPALQQAIAAGQYVFPQGLFYGGKQRSRSAEIFEQHWADWIAGSRWFMHLDFHTGLGKRGLYKLLADHEFSSDEQAFLQTCFGTEAIEQENDSGQARHYRPRGSLGLWGHHHASAEHYLYLCAEFGTYGPLSVLRGLRAENQSHHWTRSTDAGVPPHPDTCPSKQRLKELFCPADPTWRKQSLQQADQLISRAIAGLQSDASR